MEIKEILKINCGEREINVIIVCDKRWLLGWSFIFGLEVFIN